MRVHVREAVYRTVELAAPDVLRAMEQLTLKVALIDDVKVDDADCTDARRREVQRQGRAESARSDTEHTPGFQTPLTLYPDLGERKMAGVPVQFVAVEIRERHCGSMTPGVPRTPPWATS